MTGLMNLHYWLLNSKNKAMEKLRTSVALFVYQKAHVLQEIFQAIAAYNPHCLYVVMDKPGSPSIQNAYNEVKTKIETAHFNNRVELIEPPTHQGIVNIFAFGLDVIFKREKEIIILEDDTIPSESFFEYCEIMLDKYRDDKSIGSIVGTNLGATADENAYFKAPIGLPYWGWATWADRWTKMPKDFSFWDTFTDSNEFKQLLVIHEAFMTPLIRNRQQPKSWDLKWTMFQLSQNMKIVLPGINLITNDGYHELATFTRIENSEFANIKRHHTDGNKFRLSKPNQSMLLLYEEAQRKFMLEFATRKQANT